MFNDLLEDNKGILKLHINIISEVIASVSLSDKCNPRDSDILLQIKEPFVLSLTLKSGTTHVFSGKAWDIFRTTEVVPIPTCTKEKQIVFKKLPASKTLNNNTLVIIVHEESGFLLVRSKECMSSLKEVDQELVNYKGIPFESPPEVGWLVVSPFNDGNWYRAVVVSINNKNAVVEYTDYGNSEIVPLKDLKNTTEKLATINNTLFKISLKQFVGVTFNSKSWQFLAECSAKKEKFKTELFSGTDVFDLISANGNSLSKKLMELNKNITASPKLHENWAIMKTMQYSTRDTAQSKNTQPIANRLKPSKSPIIQKPKPSKTLTSPEQHEIKVLKKEPLSDPINLNNVPTSELTQGTHTLLCLYAGNIVDRNVSFCNTDSQTSELLTEITSKIWDFVQTNNNPHRPQILEVCLAKYEDEWYRAAVLSVMNNQFKLFFIDYGNIAVTTTSNIRKLPKELLKVPRLAILCTLDGLPATIEEPLLSRMVADITEENIYDVVVLEANQMWYNITIPSLMEAWKKDGLL